MSPGRQAHIDADARFIDIAKRIAFAAWLVLAASGLLSVGAKWLGHQALGGWLLGIAMAAGVVFVLAMVFLTVCVLILVSASRKKG